MKSISSQTLRVVACTLISLLQWGPCALAHEGHDHAEQAKEGCTNTGLECANAATPYLAKDGILWLVWTANGLVSVANSKDLGQSFSKPIEIANHGKFLDTGGDTRPQISVHGENIFITYDFFKDNAWNAQINVVRSQDRGTHFSAPVSLVQNGVSERFPSLQSDEKGRLFITWIDKRIAAKNRLKKDESVVGSIFYTWSLDDGDHFQEERPANNSSCECCRIASTLDNEGNAFIAYRGNLEGEIRDHVMQTLRQDSSASSPTLISNDHWVTKVCPHHGPTIAVSDKAVHAAWYTQGTHRKGVFYSYSNDQGQHWSDPFPLGDQDHIASRPYLSAKGSKVWLVWKELSGSESSVMMRISPDDGKTWSQPERLISTKGFSDHPLLVQQNNHVYLSWLTRKDGYHFRELP